MTTTAHPAPAGLSWLPAFLFRAERWPAYVGKAWLLALIPSMLLAGLVSLAMPGTAVPEFTQQGQPVNKGALAAALVLVGPFLETLVMGLALAIFRPLFGFTAAVLLSAIGWGLAHSFGGLALGGSAVPAWGLVVWWPFLILSIAYLVWRGRGLAVAIATATVVHGLQNSVGAAALLAS